MSQGTLLKQDKKSEEISKFLNLQVANLNVLYMKLHHFHWYVTGPNFFTLHEKFEEIYNEVTLHMDEIAERILTIGWKPLSTLQQCLNDASINEAKGEKTDQEMVRVLRDDLVIITSQLLEGIEIANSSNDEVTADILLGMKSAYEKHLWMLNAFLNES